MFEKLPIDAVAIGVGEAAPEPGGEADPEPVAEANPESSRSTASSRFIIVS